MTQPFTATKWMFAALAGALLAPAGCADSNQPDFGHTQSAETAPPPITGGTLLALSDGQTAVAADPDRDAIFVVDLRGKSARRIGLTAGDQPGRVIQDSHGLVHVALRGGGAIVKIDPASATVLDRRDVCPSPRGIAYDNYSDTLHVACSGGELVSLPATGGAPTRSLVIDRDLRDVVVEGTRLLVTRFRSAELLVVEQNGAVSGRLSPPSFRSFTQEKTFVPTVAWRALPAPGFMGGGAFIVHQRGVGHDDNTPSSNVSTGSGGYGAPASTVSCTTGIVHSTVSHLGPNGGQLTASPFLPAMVLPVDLAISADGNTMVVVAAGNSRLPHKTSVMKIDVNNYLGSNNDCFPGTPLATGGQVVAVAFAGEQVIVQRREPAAVDIIDSATVIPLADDSREDTGHAIFHSNSGGDIACASCHPEGGEDGHTWEFVDIGPRRTQSLRGGVMALAPFHWSGDMPDMRHLTDQVFVTRMAGPKLGDDQLQALSGFIDKVPTLPVSAPADSAAVARGAQLFADPSVGCASCHNGAHLTNLASVDVGTGGAFIVPQLRGVGARAPFIHTGCAQTLRDRFNPACGGSQHGQTSQLAPAQIDDLVAYLDTL